MPESGADHGAKNSTRMRDSLFTVLSKFSEVRLRTSEAAAAKL